MILQLLIFCCLKVKKKKNKIKKEIEYLKTFHINIFNSNLHYNNSSQFYYEKIIKKHFNKINITNTDNSNLKTNNIEPRYL